MVEEFQEWIQPRLEYLRSKNGLAGVNLGIIELAVMEYYFPRKELELDVEFHTIIISQCNDRNAHKIINYILLLLQEMRTFRDQVQ